MFHRNVRQPANHSFGAIESRAIRQLRERHEISLILRGNKSCRDARESENRQPDKARINHNSNYTRPQRVSDELSIPARCTAKEPVEQLEKPAKCKINRPPATILLGIMRFQKTRCQRRTRRQ